MAEVSARRHGSSRGEEGVQQGGVMLRKGGAGRGRRLGRSGWEMGGFLIFWVLSCFPGQAGLGQGVNRVAWQICRDPNTRS